MRARRRPHLAPHLFLALLLSLALGAATARAADPVVMAAGDVACAQVGFSTPQDCSDVYTSNLAVAQQASPGGLAALLAMGDLQYPSGGLSDFQKYFGTSWARPELRPVLRPVPGNHEYETSGASGYYGFFDSINVPHGEDGKGWYSFDVGSWHLIGLNSSNACSPVSCAQGSAQETWLKADLAATNQPCILAFLHHPLSTVSGKLRPLWQDLYDAGADLVLDGHVHGYTDKGNEAPDGSSDPAGPREIVVGTGGKSSGKYGLLRLTLGTGSVSWVFVGSGTSASGSAACHTAGGSPPPPPPPPPPAPTAAFDFHADGRTVSFTDTSTGAPTSWSWDFGDGTTKSTARNPVHTFAADKTYTVTLTAKNTGGSGSVSRAVAVAAPAPPADPPVGTPPPATTTPTPTTTTTPDTPLVPTDVGPVLAAGPTVATPEVVTAPVRLAAVDARRALRRVLAARLAGWTVVRLTCVVTGARHATCSFRARDGRRRTSGQASITLGDGATAVRIVARVTGRRAPAHWHGTVRAT